MVLVTFLCLLVHLYQLLCCMSQVTTQSEASTDFHSAQLTSTVQSGDSRLESASSHRHSHYKYSPMADHSPRTDTSTDMEADVKVDNWLECSCKT